MVELREKREPLLEDGVLRLEKRLMCRLPAEYRDFLLAHDGGIPETNIFNIPEVQNHSGVNEFLSSAMIVEEIDRYGDRLAQDLVPVAFAEGGNLVCIDSSNGSVVFWDHELEDLDPVQALAGSFGRFLEMLEPFDPDCVTLEPGQVESVWVDPDLLR